MKMRALLLFLFAVVSVGAARHRPIHRSPKQVDDHGPLPGLIQEEPLPEPQRTLKVPEITKAAPMPLAPRPVGIQTERWEHAHVNSRDLMRADKMVAFYVRNREVYEKLSKLRANGVPPLIICGFHMRESDSSFGCHLHEGSPLTHRTRYVPKGRPLHPDPPYTFLVSAEDALYSYEHLENHDWRHSESALQAAINYNGSGYDKKGVPSPYMWAGTNIYVSGKYVSDGRYDSHAVDKQLGLAAVMKRAADHGIAIDFDGR